eukprot:825760-Pelagomonas_calceolata.AAC.2
MAAVLQKPHWEFQHPCVLHKISYPQAHYGRDHFGRDDQKADSLKPTLWQIPSPIGAGTKVP